MITSRDNPKIKRLRALQADPKTRREEGAFVVEGVRLVEEALESKWAIDLLIHTADLGVQGKALLEKVHERGLALEEVSEPVLQSVSDTQTPQGILAAVRMQTLLMPTKLDFVLIVDGVRDPGNLGTILRTARAAGVQRVFLPPGNVDPFSPKVLRAAMGAHFHLGVDQLDWQVILETLLSRGLQIYLADSGEGEICYRVDLRPPLALVIGGEAEGAGIKARQAATRRIHIPMPGGSESLNAAVAAGILLFEIVRQRKEPR